MSNDFKYLHKNCPVCGGSSKNNNKCRESLLTGFVWCGNHSYMGDVPGYTAKLDGRGMVYYRPSYERLSAQQIAELKAQREALAKQKKASDDKALRFKPDEYESYLQISNMIRRGAGAGKFTEELLARGLTQDQIKKFGYTYVVFGDVVADKKVIGKKPIAGLDRDGIFRGVTGLILPIKTINGIYHSYEIKADQTADFNIGKYVHPKTKDKYLGYTANYLLLNGERALDFNMNDTADKQIILCEGTLKAQVAFSRLGISVVGANKGDFTKSASQVKELVATYPNAQYMFALDAGAANNSMVRNQVAKSIRVFESLGVNIQIIDYGQWVGQGDSYKDIDEISTTDWVLRPLSDLLSSNLTFLPSRAADLDTSKAYGSYRGETTQQTLEKAIRLAQDSPTIRHILFNAPTGVGKTHAVAEIMESQELPVVYLARSQKNPDIDKLKTFTRLATRNNSVESDEWLGDVMTENNCHKSDIFQAAYKVGAETSGICKSCPFFGKCRVGYGEGFGFLSEYARSIRSKKLLATVNSFRAKYMQDNTLLFLEESGALEITKKYTIKNTELLNTQHEITSLLVTPEDFKKFQPLLEIVRAFISLANKEPKGMNQKLYGWSMNDYMDHFQNINPREAKRGLVEFNAHMSKINGYAVKRGNGFLNWLQMLVDRLVGTVNNQFIFNNGKITITTVNQNLRDLTERALLTIHMDATLSKEQLAIMYQIDPGEILELKIQPENYANVDFTHITAKATKGLGQKGRQVVNGIIDTITAQQIDQNKTVGLIDYKSHNSDKNLRTLHKDDCLNHWAEARGSNEFESVDSIIIADYARANLGAVHADYCALSGENVTTSDPGFKQHYTLGNVANLIQEIGRIRSMRRSHERLSIFLISETPPKLPHGIKLQLRSTEEYGIQTYTRSESSLDKIQSAIASLVSNGKKVTQGAVAQLLNMTKQGVYRIAKAFGSWAELVRKATDFVDQVVEEQVLTNEQEQTVNNIISGTEIPEEIQKEIESQDLPKLTRDTILVAIALLRLPKAVRNKLIKRIPTNSALDRAYKMWVNYSEAVDQKISCII